MSRKKEKLAVAQLNLRQLKIRQQLDKQQHAIREKQEKEEQEIQRKRELLDAEMEAERAVVHFRFMKKLMNYKKTRSWSTWSLLYERMKSQTARQSSVQMTN